MKNNYDIKGFTFFDNYYDLYKVLKTDKKKAEFMDAIFGYMFEDKTPANLSEEVTAYLNNIFMPLEKSKKKILAGTKGGKNSKPNSKQKEKQINKQNSKQKTNEIYISYFFISNFLFLNKNDKELLKNKIIDWVKYKQEKNKPYKEQGLKSLLRQIENKTREYGVEKIVDLIDECMANNYQGIIFEKLKQSAQKETMSEKMKRLEKEAEEYDRLEAMKND